MEQITNVNQCNDLIGQYKKLASEADQDYQFSLAAGNFERVADAKKRLSLYRREIGQLIKKRMGFEK